MKRIILSLGAASLAITPVGVSANTRSGDVVPSAAKVTRSVQGVEKTESMAGSGGLIAVFVFWAAIVGIILATENDDLPDSPG